MQQNPLKLYLFKRIPDVPWLPILEINFGKQEKSTLFQDIDPDLYRGIWDVVDTIADADYCMFPHGYNRIKKQHHYIDDCVSQAQMHDKKIILFAYQDSHEDIFIPRTIVFRSSQYRSQLQPFEIIMPAFVEDVGRIYGLKKKEKGKIPRIGFVGKASFKNVRQRLGYVVKNIVRTHPYKEGLYYRRKALSYLIRSDAVNMSLVIRTSYSGNKKSIGLDPTLARSEYVENMQNNDFALCVKGDGNYSLRFYEALSLGRIPLFVDTECILPLEDIIRYDDVMIRVFYTKLDEVAVVARTRFKGWSEQEYARRQILGREMFEKYLYMPAFLRHVLSLDFLAKYNTQTL